MAKETKKTNEDKIVTMLGKVLDNQKSYDERLGKIEKKIERYETGMDDRFKEEAKEEDIQKAKATRKGIDPRIARIVDNVLGEDFAIRINPEKDKPGFRLDIIVPPRLSLLPERERPVKDPNTGEYKKVNGVTVMEKYKPEDVRSRQIASTDSFDVIRKHCERVRSNIIATYQKLNRPIPGFKLK